MMCSRWKRCQHVGVQSSMEEGGGMRVYVRLVESLSGDAVEVALDGVPNPRWLARPYSKIWFRACVLRSAASHLRIRNCWPTLLTKLLSCRVLLSPPPHLRPLAARQLNKAPPFSPIISHPASRRGREKTDQARTWARRDSCRQCRGCA